jgi:hypothetical protein
MSDQKGFDYFNTAGFWHHDVCSTIAAGFMGAFLLTLPGTATLAFKSAKGVSPSDAAPNGTLYITDAEEANIQAKSGNNYRTVAGNGNLLGRQVRRQDYIDAVRFIHFMYARLSESVIFTFQNNPRIPFSDAGIEIMKGAILNPLISWTKQPYMALSGCQGRVPVRAGSEGGRRRGRPIASTGSCLT